MGVEDIEGAVAYAPPDTFRHYWAEVEACSGLRGDFDRVRWHTVGDRHHFRIDDVQYGGYWFPSHDILLAGRRVNDQRTIRHEMLHDLLGHSWHPPEFFVTRCGEVVHPR